MTNIAIQEQDLTYSIIFDIPKEGKIAVNKFVEGMKDCLTALEEINHAIVNSIDSSIQVVSYIEQLKAGSIEYKLQDKIADKEIHKKDESENSGKKEMKADEAIDLVFASGLSVVTGDYSASVLLLLKAAKNTLFRISNNRKDRKTLEKEICDAIKNDLEESKINNVLKGYYLDEKRLLNAVKHFANGVKKTQDNVFYKENDNAEPIHIDSSLADMQDITPENNISNEANPPLEVILRIKKPDLDGKSKWDFYWNKKISASIKDEDFLNTIKLGLELSVKTKLKVSLQVISKLDANGNIIEGAEEYIIHKVIEILKEKPQPKLL